MIKWYIQSVFLCITVLVLVPCTAVASEVELKASSSLPKQTAFTQQFIEFINQVNQNNVNLKIRFLGGPEAVPPKQLGRAVQNDVVDIAYGPTNYYPQAPEYQALIGSRISAMQARKNGALKTLDKIYREKLHSHLLGWFASLPNFFHIYTQEKPHFNSQGHIKGQVRLRIAQGIYRAFVVKAGFTPVSIQAPNVYTALQRGVVNGVAWPLIGIKDLSWDQHLKYRIEPGFFRNNTCVLISLKSWKSLTKKQRTFLQQKAIEFEKTSYRQFKHRQKKAASEMQKSGNIVPVKLHGQAKKNYQHLAHELPWATLKQHHGEEIGKLKRLFTSKRGN